MGILAVFIALWLWFVGKTKKIGAGPGAILGSEDQRNN